MTFRTTVLKQLVDTHGKAVTLRSVSHGTYSPATGSVTNTNTDTTVKVFFGSYHVSEMSGTTIEEGDRKAVVNTLDTSGTSTTEPKVGDFLIGQGDTVRIENVQKIFSGTTIACYICQVRE